MAQKPDKNKTSLSPLSSQDPPDRDGETPGVALDPARVGPRKAERPKPSPREAPEKRRKSPKKPLFTSKNKELREYYLSTYQFLNAGFTPLEAHRNFFNNRKQFVDQRPYRKIEDTLMKGEPASKAMLEQGDYFPEYHSRFIEVGEATGKMDMAYKDLYSIVEQKINLKYLIAKEMWYPVFVLVSSFFITPLPVLVQGGLVPYAIQSLTPLLISIALFFLVPVIFRSLRSRKSTGMFIDTALYSLSIFRTFYLIQYARAFLALNKAGVQVLETLRFSASAVDNRYFRKNTASFKDSIARGNTLADTLNQEIFPLDFRQIVSSGEISGKLDFSLEKYLENLEFTFKHRLKIIAKLSSVILYILIICVLGLSVISKYIKYFGVK